MWRLVLVSLLWGCTNPLMKKGSEGGSKATSVKKEKTCSRSGQPVDSEWKAKAMLSSAMCRVRAFALLILDWRFSVPFGLNQLGSILYMRTLGSVRISVAVPFCTALTAVFTTVTAHFLGERQLDSKTIKGLTLVVIGTVLCQL